MNGLKIRGRAMTPERYKDLLVAVNGRAVTQGMYFIPIALDMPLGENAEMPAGPPGTLAMALNPGDWDELIVLADKFGIDIALF